MIPLTTKVSYVLKYLSNDLFLCCLQQMIAECPSASGDYNKHISQQSEIITLEGNKP